MSCAPAPPARQQVHARLKERGEAVTRGEVRAQQARDAAGDARAELGRLAERLGLEAEPSAEPLPDAERADLEGRIERLQRRREQIGPVNPLAQDEYNEALAHVEELETMREDLENALRELRGLIRDTDRRIQEAFEETFTAAAENFEEVAAQLFPGGRGRLRLVREDTGPRPVLGGGDADEEAPDVEERAEARETDEDGAGPGDDMGVEIEITPAGKATKRLTLLSGGEKSLTALAFLFAVFLARPCPFYILDEVEAALDDLNIDRFLKVLGQFSDRAQFIVVTHQKRTMEAADCLYGVSMAGNGVSRVISRRLPPRQEERAGGRGPRRDRRGLDRRRAAWPSSRSRRGRRQRAAAAPPPTPRAWRPPASAAASGGEERQRRHSAGPSPRLEPSNSLAAASSRRACLRRAEMPGLRLRGRDRRGRAVERAGSQARGRSTPRPSPRKNTPKLDRTTPTAYFRCDSGSRASGRCSTSPSPITKGPRPAPAPTTAGASPSGRSPYDRTTRAARRPPSARSSGFAGLRGRAPASPARVRPLLPRTAAAPAACRLERAPRATRPERAASPDHELRRPSRSPATRAASTTSTEADGQRATMSLRPMRSLGRCVDPGEHNGSWVEQPEAEWPAAAPNYRRDEAIPPGGKPRDGPPGVARLPRSTVTVRVPALRPSWRHHQLERLRLAAELAHRPRLLGAELDRHGGAAFFSRAFFRASARPLSVSFAS